MADGGSARLPGVPDDDEADPPIVLHVDVDCFYASCERLREPELRGEPVVVGMGYEPGDTVGAVATASYEAREYGVESAQAISVAVQRLPPMDRARQDPDLDTAAAGYYRPVDMEFYESVAADVKAVLRDCADVVREVSVDEAYLDVTDRTGWEVAEGFARHVKGRIAREVGVTASVGVAPTMSAAKVASDHDKPDGLVVVEPGEVAGFLAPLDVAAIHGIGPKTARRLGEMGIETAGDLADADPAALVERFGDRGRAFYRRANGRDDREVRPTGRPKSLSSESAFADPVTDPERKRERIRALSASVADRARSKDALYRTIGIKVVEPPFEVNTRARSLPGPVDDPPLVTSVAVDLLEEFAEVPVRKLGVRVSNLSFADADQASLDGWTGDDGSADAGDDPSDDATTTASEDADRDGRSGPGRGQTSLEEFDRASEE